MYTWLNKLYVLASGEDNSVGDWHGHRRTVQLVTAVS